MNQEQPQEPSVSIEYDHRTLGLKRDIQMAVISHFCKGDIHNTEKVAAWINEYSKDFREIFERKIREEVGFLDRAEHDPDSVTKEIIAELESIHTTLN